MVPFNDMIERSARSRAESRNLRGVFYGAAPMPEKEELKVFVTAGESTCGECDEVLGRDAWITLAGERGALCPSCADLDHLVFLPAGDVALTWRARKHAALTAIVLKWSRARKHYERQGLLVEEAALVLTPSQEAGARTMPAAFTDLDEATGSRRRQAAKALL